ncbi:transcriptional repressor NsdA [Streptomyces atacamensis]|uniref:transcriptional repressor NsdA n=1 Tax=Streptomyces atacamensis TaxID=531966 RepID=UPI00399C8D21
MGGNGNSGEVGTAGKRPNGQLASWFARSGWSKGELARQVNRRARRTGAHHISTDTSRVRRWLDGEQPREPIPRILSELFSERFGCVVAVEDLGLRAARQTASDGGVDLPWTGPQTVAMISEFSRSDLMLARRGFLGTSLGMAAGPALIEPMQRWLVPAPAAPAPGERFPGAPQAPARNPGARGDHRLSDPELELLEQTIVMFRQWDAQCGGGLRRKAVVGQLHEVTDLLQEHHAEPVRRRLFRVTAELAELAGWMSYDVGLQPTAQKYFVLALHAAKEAGDRPLGAYVLSDMGRQMIHLGRPEDALELVHLAQYGGREDTTPRTQAMLHAVEARAYANMGRPDKCHRAVRMAEETFAEATEGDADPDWIGFFSEAELHAENAHSYRDLAYVAGRSPAYLSLAQPAMRRAVELFGRECGGGRGHQRSYALNLVGMATVHLLQREPEQCAEMTGRAMRVAKRLRSERVDNRIRKTVATAAREFGDVAEVAELTERLADELPEGETALAS